MSSPSSGRSGSLLPPGEKGKADKLSLLRVYAFALIFYVLASSAIAQDRPFRTGVRFRDQLQEPLVARWENVRLRTVLERLYDDSGVAILLDRRIDPSQTPLIEFTNLSLQEGLPLAATGFGAGISLPDNVIYLGPIAACQKLRTLIALRTAELDSLLPKVRQQTWLKLRTITWDDLDSPREILSRLEVELGLQIQNPQLIEHDLWSEATLPEVTGIAALSLILIQFDLTWAWRESGEQIELVPIPDQVVIERSHTVRGKPIKKTLDEWRAVWPEIEFREAEGKIMALATIEEHEAIASGPNSFVKPDTKAALKPLSQRRFDGQIKDISAKNLMTELEKSGIVFEYDADELADAGVDLDRFVQLNARKLPAQEFFRAVFDPLGVTCTIDGVTVTLRAK